MANIRKRTSAAGSVSYQVQVRVRGFPPQVATFERVTDAKIWAQRTEAAIREGLRFPEREAKRHTIAELADRELEIIERKRPQALKQQRALLGWWKAQLGHFTLASVTPALIAEKRDLLLQENIGTEKKPRRRSPPTANRYLASLSKAFSDAVREWHWVNENPLRRVSKEAESQGRVRFLSIEERNQLLAACEQSSLQELHLIVLLALTTGMRRGEILGLRWADIDLKRKLAVLHNTKNKERRSAPLVGQVTQLLEAYGKVRRLDTELLFPNPGKPKKPVEIDHWFQLALKAAKIENFRFHDLRHTAASYLAMSGATPPEIAAVLGHKTLQMVKRYAHLSDAHTGSVIERMTNKFFGEASG